MNFNNHYQVWYNQAHEFLTLFHNLKAFEKVTRLSVDTSKPFLKATLKETDNLINNQNFLVDET